MTQTHMYFIKNKKVTYKKYRNIFLFISSILLLSYTYATYTSIIKGTSNLEVAQWKIIINGMTINKDTETLDNSIELKVDGNSSDEIIRAGDTGFFDIEINPNGTDVAIDYQITMDFSSMPEEIEILSYAKLVDGKIEESGDIPQNNTFLGDIKLKTDANTKYRLDNRDTVIYRMYWKWNGTDFEIDYNDNYNVKSNLIVMQKI